MVLDAVTSFVAGWRGGEDETGKWRGGGEEDEVGGPGGGIGCCTEEPESEGKCWVL